MFWFSIVISLFGEEPTPSATVEASNISTATHTSTSTLPPTLTATITYTPTITFTPTLTYTPTNTFTATITPTMTVTLPANLASCIPTDTKRELGYVTSVVDGDTTMCGSMG
ncbi:MAG: hypothetical protein N2C13_03485 [Chloroflexota bacterium]